MTALYAAHPEYEYTLFVRNQERADAVSKAFPGAKNIRFVFGSLDSADVLAAAAAEADVVLHTANSADDGPSARAILAGLKQGHSKDAPGVYIHVSGTNVLTGYDNEHQRFGQPPIASEAYNDYDGVERVTKGLPDDASHRDIDLIVLAAARQSPDVVRTAIVSPPTIYGRGRGPVNRRSIQVPVMAEYLLKTGVAPVVAGSGETSWDNVHVHDLSALFVLLVEAGVDPARRGDDRFFGANAYYFANNYVTGPSHRWSDVAVWLAAAAAEQRFVATAAGAVQRDVPFSKLVSAETPGHVLAKQTLTTNSRGEAVRAKTLLGWKPVARTLQEEVGDLVADEAVRLGITAKY